MIAVQRLSIRQIKADRARLRRAAAAALAVVVAIAVARTVIWPPQVRTVERVADARVDVPADALAQNFAAAWLTIDTSNPQRRRDALAPFGQQPTWNLDAPTKKTVRRSVKSTQVAQVAPRADGSRVVVVEAQLSSGRTTYLAVRVQRTAGGDLQIVGSPAVVAAPTLSGAQDVPNDIGDPVSDEVLEEVVTRGLRNLLGGRVDDLRADLSPDARVGIPDSPLRLVSVQRVFWTQPGQSVLVRLIARDADGLQLPLDYELDLTQTDQGRWLIAAVHVPA